MKHSGGSGDDDDYDGALLRWKAAREAAYEDAAMQGLCEDGRIEAMSRVGPPPASPRKQLNILPERGLGDNAADASLAEAELTATKAELNATESELTATKAELNASDLHSLMTRFYATIASDDLLAQYFDGIDMTIHMPKIVAFWETIVFDMPSYRSNAFKPHLSMPGLSAAHFERWVLTLENTINAQFAGARADRMKSMARRIAYSMQLRLGLTPFAALNDTVR